MSAAAIADQRADRIAARVTGFGAGLIAFMLTWIISDRITERVLDAPNSAYLAMAMAIAVLRRSHTPCRAPSHRQCGFPSRRRRQQRRQHCAEYSSATLTRDTLFSPRPRRFTIGVKRAGFRRVDRDLLRLER